jgi:hypothetical protein
MGCLWRIDTVTDSGADCAVQSHFVNAFGASEPMSLAMMNSTAMGFVTCLVHASQW